MLQRLQDLVSIALTQLDRALLEVHKGIEMCWTKWMASIGQVVDTRVLGKVQKRKCSEEASPNWSLTKAYDGSVDQNGCGAQRAVRRCAVVFRLDRVVHGKRLGSHRRCSTRLECESVATSLSGVFPEERCKVGGADDVVAEAGDSMDANMIVKRPPKVASESSGRSKDAEFVCWYYEKE